MRAFLAAIVWLAVATASAAQDMVVSDTVTAVSLTIYPDDLAMVTETRRVNVPAGRSTIAFTGVSDRIVPQSVVLRAFEGVTLERNFDYDLLGRAALFENAVGETIRLTRIDRRSGRTFSEAAEVVSAAEDAGVVVRTERGLEGLFCSGLAVRAGFDGLPPGLRADPTFSVEVEADEAGERELRLSYLTTGMGWAADYRLDVDTPASALLGWLSLRNDTNLRVEAGEVSVVAGEVAREGDTRAVDVPERTLRAACYPIGSTKSGTSNGIGGYVCPNGAIASDIDMCPLSAPMREVPDVTRMEMMEDEIIVTASRRARTAIREDFADYKLYRAPQPVTLAAHQTKQIAFVSADDVAVDQLFYLSLDALPGVSPQPLSVRYDVDNAEEGALAEPLPRGDVRVFVESATMGAVYVGQDGIGDLPVGQDVEVVAGRSPTVFARETAERDGRGAVRRTLQLSNAGPMAASVVMDTRYVPKARVDGAERVDDEDIPTFLISVPANGRVEVEVVLPQD